MKSYFCLQKFRVDLSKSWNTRKTGIFLSCRGAHVLGSWQSPGEGPAGCPLAEQFHSQSLNLEKLSTRLQKETSARISQNWNAVKLSQSRPQHIRTAEHEVAIVEKQTASACLHLREAEKGRVNRLWGQTARAWVLALLTKSTMCTLPLVPLCLSFFNCTMRVAITHGVVGRVQQAYMMYSEWHQ